MDLTKFDGHTPGPWHECDHHGRRWIEPRRDDAVAQIVRTGAQSETFANSALIKAAPELLAEVRRLTTEAAALRRERDELKADQVESDAVREQLADLLHRTAIAVRGPEPELTRWSWHDVPERVAAAIAALGGAVQAAAEAMRERDELAADYSRLLEKHNNLHVNAKRCRDERDELAALKRELLEALQGAYSLAIGRTATYQHQHQLAAPHPTHAEILSRSRAAIAKASAPTADVPAPAEPQPRPTCSSSGLLGATSGVGRECDYWADGVCTSPEPCQHQQPVKPCRTCGPDGCSDSTSCPRGERCA